MTISSTLPTPQTSAGSHLILSLRRYPHQHWTRKEKSGEETERVNDPNGVGPDEDPADWRHAIPVIDGVVHQWLADAKTYDYISLPSLWILPSGVDVDKLKGYMRDIHRVFLVSLRGS